VRWIWDLLTNNDVDPYPSSLLAPFDKDLLKCPAGPQCCVYYLKRLVILATFYCWAGVSDGRVRVAYAGLFSLGSTSAGEI